MELHKFSLRRVEDERALGCQTTSDNPAHKWSGLDLDTGAVRDNRLAGVLEPAISKVKMIRFATEAAITILRIDDAIKMNPAERPSHGGHDEY